MLWHIELKLCIWLCFNVLQIKFECRHFALIFEWVMSLFELWILEIHSFPQFSPACFDILSWNFAHDFVLMVYRARLSVVILRQFLYVRLQTGRIIVWHCQSWSPSVSHSFPHFLWHQRSKAPLRDHFVRRLSFCLSVCHTFGLLITFLP